MPCTRPIHGFASKALTKNGKRSTVFNVNEGYKDMPRVVPCGVCTSCRLEKSRQKALRCTHEAKFHKEGCFITLTYDEKHLPKDGSLNKKHFQDFMKRLRERLVTKSGKKKIRKKIRYYHAGEYGEKKFRPHYHALIFGHDFEDKVFHEKKVGVLPEPYDTFRSKTLEEIWGKGMCVIGAITFESAAYVARYVMKKRYGDGADEFYERVNTQTGEIYKLQPEYNTGSQSLGKHWIEKFYKDVYPHDFVMVRNGIKLRPPKYYDKYLETINPQLFAAVKAVRNHDAKEKKEDNTHSRLEVKEQLIDIRIKRLKRE